VATPLTPGQVFAERVKARRKRLGWTQQQLADRLREYGLPTDRTTIVKLEKGERAQAAPLDRLFAFAAALGVAPVHLFVPLDDDASIAIGNTTLPAPHARSWIRGETPLPLEPDFDYREMPRSEMQRRLELYLARLVIEEGPIVGAATRGDREELVRRIVDDLYDREEDDHGE
jgi:transcriptional regulator with XRE-family HTH domain